MKINNFFSLVVQVLYFKNKLCKKNYYIILGKKSSIQSSSSLNANFNNIHRPLAIKTACYSIQRDHEKKIMTNKRKTL